MRNILAIARRELGAYFSTTTGWLVLCAFLLITGFFYASMVSYYAMQATQMAGDPYGGGEVNLNDFIAPFFANMGVILLMLCPALSMRLFSEDRKARSIELLLTSPVSTLEIVLGKYLGGMGFVTVMLLCTAHYPAMLYWMGQPDTGVICAAYLSVFLLVGAFMAAGLLTSAFTESQVVALVASFAFLLLIWVLTWASGSGAGSTTEEVLRQASMITHLEEMSKGLIHVKSLVYYASFIGVALFATHQRVEAYRWR